MRSCKSQGNVPLGIAEQLNFTLSFEDMEMKKECNRHCAYAASRISDILITYYKRRSESLRQKKFNLKEKLMTTLDRVAWATLDDKVTKTSAKLEQEQQTTHSRKLLRDSNKSMNFIAENLPHSEKKAKTSRRFKKKPQQARNPPGRRKRNRIKANKMDKTNNNSQLNEVDINTPPPVINLTDKILTEGHMGIFKKGPSFTPTPRKANIQEFLADIEAWKTKLRNVYFFEYTYTQINQPTNKHSAAERTLIKKAGTTRASYSSNPALELYFEKIDIDIKNSKEKKFVADNISKESNGKLLMT